MAQLRNGSSLSVREKARVRELLRYFPSGREPHAPNPHVATDQDSSTGPQLSADPALTAFAQLAALRVDCERTFISLIDSEEQHIVAEATRSISLNNSTRCAPGDGLSFGWTKLDLMEGVCGGTIKVLTADHCNGNVQTDNIFADQTRYVINDFTKEERYRDRPFVTGFPFMRFYADVPITTVSGHVIGSLAVVDSKPRDGLLEEHYSILAEIASTVMDHLVLLKAGQEHDRAGQLLTGLKDLVQRDSFTPFTKTGQVPSGAGQDRPGPSVLGARDDQTPANSAATLRMGRRSSIASGSDTTEPTDTESLEPTSGDTRPSSSLPSATTPALSNTDQYMSSATQPPVADFPIPSSDLSRSNHTKIIAPGLQTGGMPRNIRRSFKNAAKTLSQSMDLEGVVFLDAAPANTSLNSGKFGYSDLLERPPQFHVPDPEQYDRLAALEPLTGADLRQPRNRPAVLRRASLCAKLGESVRGRFKEGKISTRSEMFSLPEHVHRHLQCRHPRGTILTQDQDSGSEPTTPGFSDVEDDIWSFFPEAHSILYMPLWDPTKLKWAVSAFGWTSNPCRVFSS